MKTINCSAEPSAQEIHNMPATKLLAQVPKWTSAPDLGPRMHAQMKEALSSFWWTAKSYVEIDADGQRMIYTHAINLMIGGSPSKRISR